MIPWVVYEGLRATERQSRAYLLRPVQPLGLRFRYSVRFAPFRSRSGDWCNPSTLPRDRFEYPSGLTVLRPPFPRFVVLCALSLVVLMAVFFSFVQFASLSVFLFVLFFGFGLAFFGLPASSVSGELVGESVQFGPVPVRRRSVARSASAVEVLVVELPPVVEVRSAAGVLLHGAARARRLRYLASRS